MVEWAGGWGQLVHVLWGLAEGGQMVELACGGVLKSSTCFDGWQKEGRWWSWRVIGGSTRACALGVGRRKADDVYDESFSRRYTHKLLLTNHNIKFPS